MKCKRNKKFLGAAMAAIGAISSIVSAASQAKAAKQENERQIEAARLQHDIETEQVNNQNATQRIQALNQTYANQDYTDEYYDRTSFKCGGKKKKRCFLGSTNPVGVNASSTGSSSVANLAGTANTAIPINDISSGIGLVGDIASNIITSVANSKLKPIPTYLPTQHTTSNFGAKTNIQTPSYLRCGGKLKQRKRCK